MRCYSSSWAAPTHLIDCDMSLTSKASRVGQVLKLILASSPHLINCDIVSHAVEPLRSGTPVLMRSLRLRRCLSPAVGRFSRC